MYTFGAPMMNSSAVRSARSAAYVQFACDFVASIEGASMDTSTKELSGGAQIYYIFNDVFQYGAALSNIDATQNLDN